jgi:hypothetical protein
MRIAPPILFLLLIFPATLGCGVQSTTEEDQPAARATRRQTEDLQATEGTDERLQDQRPDARRAIPETTPEASDQEGEDQRAADETIRRAAREASEQTAREAARKTVRPASGEQEKERQAAARGWRTLEPGLELGQLPSPKPSALGDSMIRLLRIDPGRFDFRLLNASADKKGRGLTARRWCIEEGLVAAVNASMYQQDYRTSISLMRTRTHVNNPRLSKDMSILAFDRLDPGVPPVMIIDRQCEEFDVWKEKYGTFVQSIRMLSCKGKNVWTQQPKEWSTAAIGTDERGNVLFIHVRSPFSTHDLIDILRTLPIALSRAMYVEGGPEAQLFVRSGGEEHEFVGSYETAFMENDDNDQAWAVPNVVGITRRAGASE